MSNAKFIINWYIPWISLPLELDPGTSGADVLLISSTVFHSLRLDWNKVYDDDDTAYDLVTAGNDQHYCLHLSCFLQSECKHFLSF